MDNITVTITDATGTKSQEVMVPSQAPTIRVMARVIQAMGLPVTGPDGMPMSYKFHQRSTGRQLRDDDTLLAAGVVDGDVLRLVPEITAG